MWEGRSITKAHPCGRGGASLRHTHVGGASLRHTHVEGASLRHTHVGGASLRHTHVGGASLRQYITKPKGNFALCNVQNKVSINIWSYADW